MWSRVDDNIPHHPKFVKAGALPSWLWVCGNCYCNRYLTDGFIPVEVLSTLGQIPNVKTHADKLVAVGLWESCEGGYRVHDFHDHNPHAATVKAKREQDRERKRAAEAKSLPLIPDGIQTESRRNPDGIAKELQWNPKLPAPAIPVPSLPSPIPFDKLHSDAADAASPVSKLLSHYHHAYLSKFKEKPDINGAKDGKILKMLAQAHGAATVAERINRLINSTDVFISKSGRTIGVLKACWNKLGSGGGIKPAALPIEQPNTWTQVRTELKANLNRQNFQTWFADTRLVSNGGSRLVVSVPSAQAQSWIAQWYADDVRKAAESIERGLSVEFVVRS